MKTMYKTLLILALGLGGCSTQESQPEPKKEKVIRVPELKALEIQPSVADSSGNKPRPQ